ncbi:hypothetical protein [Paenibacillus planticolens]|uniref:Uncharacterized protein n=1 Tax=Paenibacillus planticolens TaxID=2654976 RepID=A0ABX1ZQG7_9BACL|nr:hypothetical protein [Paenibacillus planticolens]NOV02324.1 hypothetical protein [Paenibacillus planticolens]
MSREKLVLDVILETSAGILSLMPAAGVFVGPVKAVVSDYATRQLSKREEFRVGEVAKYCISKIKEKCDAGEALRDDDFFFANNENYRSKAEEIFEGVLTKCKNEHEELKSLYIGNIFVNASFYKRSLGEVNHVLKLADNMTYRQICLVALFFNNKPKLYNLRNTEKEYYASEEVSILQEIYDLTRMGILQKEVKKERGITVDELNNMQLEKAIGWDEVIPNKLALSALGMDCYRLMGIEDVTEHDLEKLVNYLK